MLPQIDAAGITIVETAVRLFHQGGFLAETIIGDLNPLPPEQLAEIGEAFYQQKIQELPVVGEGPYVERAVRLMEIAIADSTWPEGWVLTVMDVEGPVAFTHVGGFVYIGTDLMDQINDAQLLWVFGATRSATSRRSTPTASGRTSSRSTTTTPPDWRTSPRC